MPGKMRPFVLPVAAIALLLLMVAWMAGYFADTVEPGLNPVQAETPADIYVVEPHTIPITEAAPASVEAKFSTMISSRVLASITKIYVRSGDTVTEGQLLVELEKSDLQAKAKQASEHIRAISARLTEAEKNLQRATILQKQGIVPMADLEQARANRDALRGDLAAAKQALKEAESAVAYTEIRSPIPGRVVDRFAEPGNMAYPGNKLLSLYNPQSLRVEAQVRERLALSLEVGQNVTVDIPSLNKTLNAVIEERVPAAEPGSRSFLVKARIPQDNVLLPGMYARMQVPAGEEQRFLIPSDRVVNVGQLQLIWVWQDGQAYRRFVRTGDTVNGMTHILSGVQTGDQILRPPAATT